MRVVIQRVTRASVKEGRKIKEKINRGLLLYLAIAEYDTQEDAELLAEKIAKLRIFSQQGKQHDFQRSIKDSQGEILVIPNYTLYADLSEGNRPYFGEAAAPEEAKPLYDYFLNYLQKLAGKKSRVKSGTFGEFMVVTAVNDGPATILLETAILEGDYYENGEEDYAEEFDDLLEKLGVDIEI